jgi:hypothetical protein
MLREQIGTGETMLHTLETTWRYVVNFILWLVYIIERGPGGH